MPSSGRVRVETSPWAKWRRGCGELPWPWALAGAVVLLLLLLCLVVIGVLSALPCPSPAPLPLDDLVPAPNDFHDEARSRRIVDMVNSRPNGTWRAVYKAYASIAPKKHAVPALSNSSLAALQDLLNESRWRTEELQASRDPVPWQFDARVHWPHCSSISHVPNQAGCGSCWAVAAAGVMSDRTCIHGGGPFRVSAQDVLSCCPGCGVGCQGGSTAIALARWVTSGFVSGGDFGSFEGCRPYAYAPSCGAPCGLETYDEARPPVCRRRCSALHDRPYEEDLRFGASAYFVSTQAEAAGPDGLGSPRLVQLELMRNGPLAACFPFHEDLQYYEGGVYTHVTGERLYQHCVRVLGWGEDPEHGPFWTVANSFGRAWGEDGILRISLDSFLKNTGFSAALPKIPP